MKKPTKKVLLRGMKEHLKIIENVKNRNSAGIYEYLKKHLENSKLDFFEVINSNID